MDQSQGHGVGNRESGESIPKAVVVLLFAGAAQAANQRNIEVEISLPVAIGCLAVAISKAHPMLQNIVKRSRFAVNGEFVDNEYVVTDSASEIALIPPVSGG